jgi:hypothetical protein
MFIDEHKGVFGGRADLPRAGRAWRADRTEHVLRRQEQADVGAGGAR